MMKSFLILFFVTVLVATSNAASLGAGKAGDGGHLISCDVPHRLNGEFLDAYEGWRITGSFSFEVDLSKNPNTITNQIALQIDEARRRLSDALPSNHPIMSIFAEALRLSESANIEFVPADQVGETADAGPVQADAPKKCEIRQLVARRQAAGRTVFFFNRDYAWIFGERLTAEVSIHEALHDYFGRQPTTLAVREMLWWLGAPETYRKRTINLIQELIRTRLPVDPQRFREARQPVDHAAF